MFLEKRENITLPKPGDDLLSYAFPADILDDLPELPVTPDISDLMNNLPPLPPIPAAVPVGPKVVLPIGVLPLPRVLPKGPGGIPCMFLIIFLSFFFYSVSIYKNNNSTTKR